MSRIHVLPPDLVNKIAAGEVVERPASVVKELVENALDASATRVEIELEDGGRRLVQVLDDGTGMSAADARLCLERHATSKLRDADGLFRIASYGFRGEAVPAIASVSRLELVTCEQGAVQGTRIRVEGGELLEEGPVGAPAGTRFEVRDLFYATPARRKFLKRAETEVGHVADAVTRLALARPDVSFLLRSSGRVTFQAPATTDLRERVAAAIGKDVFPHLLPVDLSSGSLRVHGLAASPDWSTSSHRAVYLYVNGRFVRDRQVQHAIVRAYADVLPPGRFPATALFLEIPPGEVDVNVHPQKLEVRFAEGRAVYDAVLRAVSEALRTTAWLQTSPDPPPLALAAQPRQAPFGWRPAPSAPPAGAGGPGVREAAEALWPRPGDAAAVAADTDGDLPPPGYFAALRVIGQLARTYIVCEAPGGSLVVIDQHAAHERLTFDRLRTAFRERRSAGQPFLFPATLELPVGEARALADHLPALQELGFDIEPFGGTTFALKSVPAPLVGTEYAKVLADLARELAAVGHGRALEDATTDMLATMACHASVRAHQTLTPDEARALLDQLDAIDFKSRCPHGRPVVAEITLADLERRVGRR